MGNRLINPYTIYIVSFGVALLLYPLHWSGFYPSLQNSLLIFILISFFLSLIAAKWFMRGRDPDSKAILPTGVRQMILISIVLYGFWAIEFVYAGGIPAYLIFAGKPYDYRTFGVPTLHVFLVTFSSFYASYLFHAFRQSRNRIVLIFYLINLLPALLIFNRGMLIMNLSTSLFIYLYSGKSIQSVFPVRKWPLLAIAFVSACLVFGALGTLRVSREIKHFYVRSLVYEVGDATPLFKESIIPSEFFWGYLYLTSPMANLQLTTDLPGPEISTKNFVLWGMNEVLPDAVSKRINSYFGITKRKTPRIAAHLNASTIYAGSFMYGGWYTMGSMTLVLLCFPFLYKSVLPAESTYYLTGMATLNTLYLFLLFDNMLAFSGFSFQLFYPLLFSWIEKRQASSGAHYP
jgi:hypothetical protein